LNGAQVLGLLLGVFVFLSPQGHDPESAVQNEDDTQEDAKLGPDVPKLKEARDHEYANDDECDSEGNVQRSEDAIQYVHFASVTLGSRFAAYSPGTIEIQDVKSS
jgi:hypothetical protein